MKGRARMGAIGLVLLPGGRGGAAREVDDRDWDGFCDRIGWAGAEPLSEEAEARLVANVGAAILRAAANDDVEVEPARISHVAVTASGVWPMEHVEEPIAVGRSAAWARRVLVASAMVAAAAAICLVVLAALSINAHSQARLAPVERDAVPAAPARDPRAVDDPRLAPEAVPETTSSPTEERPPSRPPGARLVASAPRATSVVPRAGASLAHVAAPPDVSVSAASPVASPVVPEGDDFTTIPTPAPALTVAAAHALEASPPARERVILPDVRPSPVHTVAWTSTPGDRWYGASVAPTRPVSDLPGGVGVVAHIDIAKAARF